MHTLSVFLSLTIFWTIAFATYPIFSIGDCAAYEAVGEEIVECGIGCCLDNDICLPTDLTDVSDEFKVECCDTGTDIC